MRKFIAIAIVLAVIAVIMGMAIELEQRRQQRKNEHIKNSAETIELPGAEADRRLHYLWGQTNIVIDVGVTQVAHEYVIGDPDPYEADESRRQRTGQMGLIDDRPSK